MTRGKNRFQAASKPPYTIGDLRNLQRAEVRHLNGHGVYLNNPDQDAPIQRDAKNSYRGSIGYPRSPDHFYDLVHGDAGAGQSNYRRVELLQLLAEDDGRVSDTPYSKAYELFTCRSTDNRPRYWQANLFNIARIFRSAAGGPVAPKDFVLQYAAGFPPGLPALADYSPGIPPVGVAQFRVMVFDESGQRFYDTDVLGTRGVTAFGWGMTVFVLAKEQSFIIDRQREDNLTVPFEGLIEQSVIGARIIPIRQNNTRSIDNRTVTFRTAVSQSASAIMVPPGARRVQISSLDLVDPGAFYRWEFRATDPLNPDPGVNTTMGIIDFDPGKRSTSVLDIPNANVVYARGLNVGGPSALWSIVFELG